MFGSPIQDPKFDYLGHAAGLKTVSLAVLIGKYPTLLLGEYVRIVLGLFQMNRLKDISDDGKSMTVRYYYTEAARGESETRSMASQNEETPSEAFSRVIQAKFEAKSGATCF